MFLKIFASCTKDLFGLLVLFPHIICLCWYKIQLRLSCEENKLSPDLNTCVANKWILIESVWYDSLFGMIHDHEKSETEVITF